MMEHMDEGLTPDSFKNQANTDPMDQVRDLLFGQAQKNNDVRIEDIYTRLEDMNTSFQLRLDDLDAKLDKIAGRLGDDRIECMQQIGEGLAALGTEISKTLTAQNLKHDN